MDAALYLLYFANLYCFFLLHSHSLLQRPLLQDVDHAVHGRLLDGPQLAREEPDRVRRPLGVDGAAGHVVLQLELHAPVGRREGVLWVV